MDFQSFSYTNAPFVNMRKSPSFESEVVSQTFLGEKISIQNEEDEWVFIETSDQYRGWIPEDAIIQRNTPYNADLMTSRIATHLYSIPNIKYGSLSTVPYQTQLKKSREENDSWILVCLPDSRLAYVQKGNIEIEPMLTKKDDLVHFSKRFLGLPYTWGGRTSFGYDCSGFIQMLYQKINVFLPRDARDQILSKHLKMIPIGALTPGDLIFFGQDEKTIGHVGLSIGNNQFIHATGRENLPWLRISSLLDAAWNGTMHAIYPFRSAYQPQPNPNSF